MNKITLIIPITNLDIPREYIDTMFESVSKQDWKNFNILVPTFKDLIPKIENLNMFNLPLEFLELPSELKEIYPNYTEVVNFAVHSVNTPYFSILQYDDVLNNPFIKNAEAYIDAYPSVSVFLPIVLEFDGQNFVRSVNEAVWNIDYTAKQGYLDFETLKKMNIFSFVGATFKTDEFLSNNGYKHNIKIHFEYEYFLRILYTLSEVMVIPKFMIRHTTNRANSLSEYFNAIDPFEAKFYQSVARKEYFFADDRPIVYAPQELV